MSPHSWSAFLQNRWRSEFPHSPRGKFPGGVVSEFPRHVSASMWVHRGLSFLSTSLDSEVFAGCVFEFPQRAAGQVGSHEGSWFLQLPDWRPRLPGIGGGWSFLTPHVVSFWKALCPSFLGTRFLVYIQGNLSLLGFPYTCRLA